MSHASSAAGNRDIAIIGMACRFPGAADPEAFREMLARGTNAVTEVPRDRWDPDLHYDPEPGRRGKSTSRWGAFLGDITGFDADFFRISPREAKSLDPQQRLLLELSCEALEAAGQPLDRLDGGNCGVFVGICGSEYATLSGGADDLTLVDRYFGTGTALSVAAGRIAYTLNFHGPALSIETACSSSLVAVHLAVNSLRSGETDLCLAGGVNIALSPTAHVYFSQLGAVSGTPMCRPFDAEASGYVRGEGCGVVALKRLDDAIRDGDPVLAVIKGSAVNQDGRSGGLTAPSGTAQEMLIRAALTDARIDAAQVDYVEAHGTGTRLGDPIEATALGNVYGKAAGREHPLLIGAVKANIGHLEAAAGIAGVIKTVLALRDRRIPPQINLRDRNGLIEWDRLGLSIAPEGAAWPAREAGSPHAAVSSFGFSGTNAHVILAAAPWVEPAEAEAPADMLILPVSARSPEALERMAAALGTVLSDRQDMARTAAVCRGMALRRAHHPYRFCAMGATPAALAGDLAVQAAIVRKPANTDAEQVGPVFVFSGQGSHWPMMGRAVAAFPAADSCLHEIDALVRAEAGWSVRAAMDAEAAAAQAEIDVAQVCIFAVQIALFRHWMSIGVRPAAVVGHSMGEIAAACAAGILSLEDAAKLSVRRSRLLKQTAGRGLMAAIELDRDAVAAAIAAERLDIAIAGANSPTATVVSGEADAVRTLLAAFEADHVFCRVLQTGGVAGHSPLVASLRPELAAATRDLTPRAATVPLVSTVDGEVKAGPELDAAYWQRNLTEPVRFVDAIDRLLAMGCRSFVEISPKPVLIAAIRQTLRSRQIHGIAVGTLQPDQPPAETAARAWGALYEAGHTLDWASIYPGDGAWTPPPAYPWVRERHWITDLLPEQAAAAPPVVVPPIAVPPNALPSVAAAVDDKVAALDALLGRWDDDGLRSVNMRRLAPLVLLTPDREAAFYLAQAEGVCLAWAYLGPADRLTGDVAWLRGNCAERDLALCLLVDRDNAERLKAEDGGPTISFAGTSHRIEPLDRFDTEGVARRRLRGRLRRYRAEGPGATEDYRPGRDPDDDRAAIALIDGWTALKGRGVEAAEEVKADILSARDQAHRRYFVARRDGRLRLLLVVTSFANGNGALLDLEFYDADTPAGCSESTIVDVIALLAAEGRQVLSLGGSYCAAPTDQAEGEPGGAFARQARYKRKFGGREMKLALVAPATISARQSDALIGLLAGGRDDSTVRIADTPDALERRDAAVVAPFVVSETGTFAHSLLGRRLALAGDTIVHQSRIAASHPLAAQHVVGGQPVLPGTAYVEMAVAAAWPFRKDREVVLRDIVFKRPLAPTGGQGSLVQVTLAMEDGSPARFSVDVADDDRGERWGRLAAGKFAFRATSGSALQPPDASGGAQETVRPEELYDAFDRHGVAYGPLFRGLRMVERRADEIIAEIALDAAALRDDGGPYLLHPALLDAAMHGFAAMDGAGDQALMIQSVEEICISRVMTGADRMTACIGQVTADARVASGDLTIHAPDGAMVVRARGLLARPARRAEAGTPLSAITIDYSTLRFVPHAIGRPAAAGLTLVAGGTAPDAMALIAALVEIGGAARHVAGRPGEMLAGLAALDRADWAAISRLVLLPPDDEAPPGETGERLDVLADLVRLIADRAGPALRVWIVTRNATGPAPTPGSLAETALWNLGGVLRSEHPEWWGGVCDLHPQPAALAAPSLAAIVHGAVAEDRWAIAQGATRVARLAEHTMPAAPLRVAADGAYVVTGWSSGIGREVARWLLKQGAGRIVLLARRPPDPTHVDALSAEAARRGASVIFQIGDAADPAAIAALLAAAGHDGQRLRGVFHAAGALGDGLLINQQPARFAEAFAGKVRGAWHLHEQTRDLALDAFVLFSSAATLFGPPAQGPHVAACAAIDRLAALRRAEGIAAVSIGWGVWGQVGKAAERGLDATLATDGILPITTDVALNAMAGLAGGGPAHAYVAPMDWPRWRDAHPATAARPLFDDVEPAAGGPDATGAAVVAMSVAAAHEDVAGSCQRLRACVARTLLIDPAKIDPARSLEQNGLDSIAIVDLRERLHRELGWTVPLVDLFRAPDLHRLTATALSRTAESGRGAAA